MNNNNSLPILQSQWSYFMNDGKMTELENHSLQSWAEAFLVFLNGQWTMDMWFYVAENPAALAFFFCLAFINSTSICVDCSLKKISTLSYQHEENIEKKTCRCGVPKLLLSQGVKWKIITKNEWKEWKIQIRVWKIRKSYIKLYFLLVVKYACSLVVAKYKLLLWVAFVNTLVNSPVWETLPPVWVLRM